MGPRVVSGANRPSLTSLEPLAPGTRLIHVGPPKTGTTAIQGAFTGVRADLPRHGLHYAGPGSRPRKAGWALTSSSSAGTSRASMRDWEALVEEVRSVGDLRVLVSNEGFAAADDEAAARALRDLGGDRAHGLAVVRRLDKLLPSQWQQRVRKSQSMIPYEAWLEIVLSDHSESRHWTHFWRYHDVEALARRWRNPTTGTPMTLVVTDESDRDHLPRVFERLLALPVGTLVPTADRTNRSLSLNESELLRHLDRVADERGWTSEVYQSLVKSAVAKEIRRVPRSEDDAPIAAPRWAVPRIQELNERRIHFLAATDARVVGDVEWLRGDVEVQGEDAGIESLRISPRLAGEAVGAAVTALLERQERLEKQLEAARSGPDRRRTPERDRPEAPPRDRAEDTVPTDQRTLASLPGRDLVRVVGRRAVQKVRGRWRPPS